LAPATASALDLTGTWEGKQPCKGIADGEKDTFTCCDTTGITQIRDILNIRVNQTRQCCADPTASRPSISAATCGDSRWPWTDSPRAPLASSPTRCPIRADMAIGLRQGPLGTLHFPD
jgi:hypothetical protein